MDGDKLAAVMEMMPPDVSDEGIPHFARAVAGLGQQNPVVAPRVQEFAVAIVAAPRVHTRHVPQEQYEAWRGMARAVPEEAALMMLKFDEANVLELQRNLAEGP